MRDDLFLVLKASKRVFITRYRGARNFADWNRPRGKIGRIEIEFVAAG